MARRMSVSVPASWGELTQDQLRFLLETMVKVQEQNASRSFASQADYAACIAAQVATHCFVKWSGMEMLHRSGSDWMFRYQGELLYINVEVFADAIGRLGWLSEPPAYPVRLDTIDGAEAVAADLSSDFSFDSWLACENYWQAYQLTPNPEALRSMAEILYRREGIELTPAEALGVFYWWLGVKNMASAMFPHFFKPASEGEDGSEQIHEQMRQSVNSQIRALTKGDITKEELVLSMNALRALTELDALAREYDELNKKYPTQ